MIPPSLIEFLFELKGDPMKKAVTLKENYEFRRMYQRGKSAVSGSMVVYCRKNRLGHNRLGLTASTKLGHAVVRNRVRRRLREIYRAHEDQLVEGLDMIIVARVWAANASYWELDKSFVRLCEKLKLFRPAKPEEKA